MLALSRTIKYLQVKNRKGGYGQMPETKYGKYIINQTPENPMHPRVKYGTPLYNTLWINNQLNGAIPGAFFLECSLISAPSEVQEPTGKPHNHDFDEYLVWLGTNPEAPFDLGAEIELWLENEKHIITQTTAVFIKITAEYPPACWWDESSSPLGEVKALAKRQS
jgi:hypothetical protein